MERAGQGLGAQRLSDIHRKIVKRPVKKSRYFRDKDEVAYINKQIENLDLTEKTLVYECPLTWNKRPFSDSASIDLHVLLLEDLLILLEKEGDKLVLKGQSKMFLGRKIYSPIIKLDDGFTINIAFDSRAFYVHTDMFFGKRLRYYFVAATQEDRDNCCKYIQDTAKAWRDNIDFHADGNYIDMERADQGLGAQRLADIQRKIVKKPLKNVNITDPQVYEKIKIINRDIENLDLTEKTLVYEGPLTWKIIPLVNAPTTDLHVLLLEDLLILLQKEGDKLVLTGQSDSFFLSDETGMLTPILKLDDVHIVHGGTDPRAFILLHTGELSGYHFVAATQEDRDNWCKYIYDTGKAWGDDIGPAAIRARGPKALMVYEKALRDGSVNVYRGRILLIGQDRAGKTSLKKSLLDLPFDPKEQSTEGIEVDPSKCEIEVDQIKNWHSINKKTGSFEFSKHIARWLREDYSDFEDSEDSEDSGDELDLDVKDEISSHTSQVAFDPSGNTSKEPAAFDPSRNTSKEPEFSFDATSPPEDFTEQYWNYLGDPHVESGESVVSVDMWDFAGQHLYYASHPVFFSSRAVYLLVCNLSKALNATAQPCARQGIHHVVLENPNGETNLENLLSWLVTVHSITQTKEETVESIDYLRPPVFIVGTHADKPFEDVAVMISQIEKRISGKEYVRQVIRPFFSIDNTRGHSQPSTGHENTDMPRNDGIEALRNKIMEVLKQEPYMGEKIPIKWLNFERVIEALVAKRIYHMNLEQLQRYAIEVCFIDDENEFTTMVNFYHDIGLIIKHCSTVVLKAQWLIDLFKQLITIPPFHKTEPVNSKYWLEVETTGVLSMELVDHVFYKFIQQGLVKEDILDMMEQFGLIAKFSPSPTDVKYFVPAQLKSSPKGLCDVEPSSHDPCPMYLHFVVGFVPHGLFSQFVSRAISWCSKTGPTQPPNLYLNGAWFVIGRQVIHDLILICKKSFIKIVLNLRNQDEAVPMSTLAETARSVRLFVEGTLQDLSQKRPYQSGLQYEFCVACPYCLQGSHQCTSHRQPSCPHEDCLHFLEMKPGERLICKKRFCDKLLTVRGLEKWFPQRTSQDMCPSTIVGTSQGNPGTSDTALRVTLLASEWSSSMGGLSTLNRQLAILLANHKQVEVTLLVPQFACREEEKRAARSHNVAIREAERRPGFNDPLDWLSFPPRDLAIDIVLGHGGKLGKQAQVIRESHSCKWVQVVHTAPEELGMHKHYPKAISKGEEENRTEVDLCKLADLVVAVGPTMKEAYSSYLRSCEKHQDIIQLTPGTFSEFSDVKQATNESGKFKVLTFGRGDPEDFSLKGYDIAAKAIVHLKDSSYRLIFVGAPDGKQDEVAENLLKSGISKDQLTVRKFVQSKKRLKELLCEVDLAIMPSRTEGFGLTALEALSAGLPILASGNSGFGDALRALPFGMLFVVESADPKEWAKAIAAVRLKDRAQRLQEIQGLRTCYEEHYSWEKQCEALVEKMSKMWRKVNDSC